MVLTVYRWMSEAPRQRLGMAALQRLLAIAILFRVSTEFNFASALWGPDSIGSFKFGNQLDSLFVTTRSTQAVLCVEGLAALALLFQQRTRYATAILWFTFSTLFFRTGEVSDGGDNLTYLALMFMIGLLPAAAQGVSGSLRVWIHNLAVVAIVFQVCVVYFIAGISKAHGDAWNNGTALYLISQVEWFSLPASRAWFTHSAIATTGSYATMFFQLWFPVAMLSPLKPLFLVAAMGFHLGIAVNMGLITFSLVMAGADLSLITDREYRAYGTWARATRGRLSTAWQVRWRAPATLYLDGDCALCARLAAIVRRLDVAHRTAVVSFRDSDAYRHFGIAPEALENRMHLVVHDAPVQIRTGFDVADALCWRLPALWIAVPITCVLRAFGAGSYLYSIVARHRYWLGRTVACAGSCDSRSGTA